MEPDSAEAEPTESRVLWRKIGYWILVSVGVLLGYCVGYPVVLFAIEDLPIPDWHWLEDVIDFTIVPLQFLYDSVPVYEALLDWLDAKIE